MLAWCGFGGQIEDRWQAILHAVGTLHGSNDEKKKSTQKNGRWAPNGVPGCPPIRNNNIDSVNESRPIPKPRAVVPGAPRLYRIGVRRGTPLAGFTIST